MRCTKCRTEFHPQPDWAVCYWANSDPSSLAMQQVSTQECPACDHLLVVLTLGEGDEAAGGELHLQTPWRAVVIHPTQGRQLQVEEEVPETYRKDLFEAGEVLGFSAKASAALSRRILQTVLHNELSITKRTLFEEIEDFIKKPGTPAYLADALHAVREVGNFAAHPIKNGRTGDITEVEPGEAEWLIETLEALFDYVFVQPRRLETRLRRLNEKLEEAGKRTVPSVLPRQL